MTRIRRGTHFARFSCCRYRHHRKLAEYSSHISRRSICTSRLEALLGWQAGCAARHGVARHAVSCAAEQQPLSPRQLNSVCAAVPAFGPAAGCKQAWWSRAAGWGGGARRRCPHLLHELVQLVGGGRCLATPVVPDVLGHVRHRVLPGSEAACQLKGPGGTPPGAVSSRPEVHGINVAVAHSEASSLTCFVAFHTGQRGDAGLG